MARFSAIAKDSSIQESVRNKISMKNILAKIDKHMNIQIMHGGIMTCEKSFHLLLLLLFILNKFGWTSLAQLY